MVPDVDAHAPVVPVRLLHNVQRIGGGDDVRERKELETDDETVLGGTIAEAGEGTAGLVEGAAVRTDRLQVAALPAVRHLPRRRFEPAVIASRPRPRTHHLDLGDGDLMLSENIVEPGARTILGDELLILTDVQTDPGESRSRREGDPVLDRVAHREAEVAQHEVIRREVARTDGHRRVSHRQPVAGESAAPGGSRECTRLRELNPKE